MSIRGLVDRIGSGMINFIFFEYGGDLELVAWEKTNQKAWIWIQRKISNLKDAVPLDNWPSKMVLVFVVVHDKDDISILEVKQLVYTTNMDIAYMYEDTTSEDTIRIAEHVVSNWPDYRELKGVL